MPYDPGLAERVREIVRSHFAIDEKKMFGGLAFLTDGHLFVGILGSALIARVGPQRYEDALARPHVRKMDFTGRPMPGYVFVDPEGYESDEDLAFWVNTSHAFAAALPPKLAKGRRSAGRLSVSRRSA